MTAFKKIRFRRDTAANWQTNNPVLDPGEVGYDTTNNKIKIGNGTSNWSTLGYFQAIDGEDISPGDVECSGFIAFRPEDSAIPGSLGQVRFQRTSDSEIEIRMLGLDGQLRGATITLQAINLFVDAILAESGEPILAESGEYLQLN